MRPSENAIAIAAQCWCDPETSHIVMIPELAMAFAKRLTEMELKISWYEAPFHVQLATRNYMELSPENRTKIDNLMAALVDIRSPITTKQEK